MNFVEKYYKWIKIIIMVFAYGYLGYILINFKDYAGFNRSFRDLSWERFGLIVSIFLLLPVNWGMEAVKWKTLVSPLQKSSFFQSYKSVLSGLTTGFFTPNRIGDPLGIVLFLEPENRPRGIVLSLVGVLGQSFATLFCGMLAGLAFIFSSSKVQYENSMSFEVAAFLLVLFLASLYFSLPYLCRKLGESTRFVKLNNFLEAISAISLRKLFLISGLSFIRYSVYVFQYFFMLRLFGVDIQLTTALIAIPLNYLFVSVTPSVAFSEMGIRGSYAVLFIGAFSKNTAGVAFAGIAVWLVNYVIPMMIGSLFLTTKKKL